MAEDCSSSIPRTGIVDDALLLVESKRESEDPVDSKSGDFPDTAFESLYIDAAKMPISAEEAAAFDASVAPKSSAVASGVSSSSGRKHKLVKMVATTKDQSDLSVEMVKGFKLRMWYTYARGSTIAKLLKGASTRGQVTVVDVRDSRSDFLGGHIPDCVNVPFTAFRKQLPHILQTYAAQTWVVFHCMYSQVRGPSACKLYSDLAKAICQLYEAHATHWREHLTESHKDEFEGIDLAAITVSTELVKALYLQNVHILEKGFRVWLNDYKVDSDLVKGFDRTKWQIQRFSGTPELYHVEDW